MKNNIVLTVMNRDLVETAVGKAAPSTRMKKACRITFVVDALDLRTFKNEQLLSASPLEILVPEEDYEQYPIGAKFHVLPQ